MHVIIILLALLSIGCTTHNHKHITIEQYKYAYIDSKFNPIIQSFIYEARSRGHSVDLTNVSMTFSKIRSKKSNKTVGYCVRDPLGGIIIKINTSTWDKFGPYQQEELIFHEMAHCLIGREHCSKVDQRGPISIMYPRILKENYYKEYREELVDELFNISPECVGNDGNADELDGSLCPQAHHDKRR